MRWWVWLFLIPCIILAGLFWFKFFGVAYDVIFAPKLTYENYKDKILPRIITKESLDKKLKIHTMPYREFGDTGLYIVYVFDRSNSVKYVSSYHMIKIGLIEESLNKLALENLERTFPKDLVTNCIKDNSFTAVKLLDSYDAARVLLLPRFIPKDSKIIAFIPDQNTLAITPFNEQNKEKIKREKIPADGEPLFTKPLIVSRQGIEVLK